METRLERTRRDRKRCHGSPVITINIIHSFTYVFPSMSVPLVGLFFFLVYVLNICIYAPPAHSRFPRSLLGYLYRHHHLLSFFSHSVAYYYIEPLFTHRFMEVSSEKALIQPWIRLYVHQLRTGKNACLVIFLSKVGLMTAAYPFWCTNLANGLQVQE